MARAAKSGMRGVGEGQDWRGVESEGGGESVVPEEGEEDRSAGPGGGTREGTRGMPRRMVERERVVL